MSVSAELLEEIKDRLDTIIGLLSKDGSDDKKKKGYQDDPPSWVAPQPSVPEPPYPYYPPNYPHFRPHYYDHNLPIQYLYQVYCQNSGGTVSWAGDPGDPPVVEKNA